MYGSSDNNTMNALNVLMSSAPAGRLPGRPGHLQGRAGQGRVGQGKIGHLQGACRAGQGTCRAGQVLSSQSSLS